jgi:serine/threonine protein kinase
LASREQYEAINEVQILSKMESPYVVQYFDSFIANNNLNIVMEYCNKGDLQKMIKKAQSKNLRSLGEASTWNIILQVFMINIIFAFIIFKNILMQINVCMYACMYVCMHVCMYV